MSSAWSQTPTRLSAGSPAFLRETHFLRLRLITAAHLGTGSGTAAVDRPVIVHPWTDLPLIPDTTLKGVLRSQSATHVDQAFGSSDGTAAEQAAVGRPGRLVLGEGEPLAIPFRLEGRTTGWLVPIQTLRRLSRLNPGWRELVPRAVDTSYSTIRRSLLPDDCDDVLPAATVSGDIDPALLAHVVGWRSLPPFVLANGATARRIWMSAVERRTQTAIERGRHPGPIRKLENNRVGPGGDGVRLDRYRFR